MLKDETLKDLDVIEDNLSDDEIINEIDYNQRVSTPINYLPEEWMEIVERKERAIKEFRNQQNCSDFF